MAGFHERTVDTRRRPRCRPGRVVANVGCRAPQRGFTRQWRKVDDIAGTGPGRTLRLLIRASAGGGGVKLSAAVAAIVVGTLTGAGTAPTLRPAPEKLQPWTTILRDRQPDHAYAVVYRQGSHRLVFVAAQHENQNDGPTFRTIRAAYAAFHFDTVIAEGFPTSWGVDPARIIDESRNSRPDTTGFVAGGETVPTVIGAQEQGASLLGGEADDPIVAARVFAAGTAPTDLLGFYVLRSIPQWIEEREITDAADPRLPVLVGDALARNRTRLGLPPDILADYGQWAAWYSSINQQPIGPAFVTEEAGPLADGRFGSNRIAYAVSRVRDAYLHELIIGQLNAGKTVLVVFGGSHLMIQRPALDAVLGSPCYVGIDFRTAWRDCR